MTGIAEIDLWASVLNQAMADFYDPHYSHEVASWMRSPLIEPGSFIFICETLGLEPNRVRSVAWQSVQIAA